MKKKLILTLIACLSVSTLLASAIIFSNNNHYNLTASDQYDCNLPTGYNEIADVIEYVNRNGEGQNNFKFRGTVTRVNDDEAYIQRRNQTTLKIDAIKVTGFKNNGYILSVGNVVDINGGYLYSTNNQVTLRLTGSNQMFVSFDENPTGYGPKTYQSYDELISDERGEYYAYSQLVKISNCKFISKTTKKINSVSYVTLKFEDLFNKKTFSCLLLFEDTDNIINLLKNAQTLNHSLEIKGIYTNYKDYYGCYFIIENSNDIIDKGEYVDTNVVSQIKTSNIFYTLNYRCSFENYQIVGKDEGIAYVNFVDFYYDFMSYFVLDSEFCKLYEYKTNIDETFLFTMGYPDLEQYLTFLIDVKNDIFAIYKDDLHIFTNINPIDDYPYYIADGIETDFCQVTNDSKLLKEASQVVYDLGEFNIDIVKDKYNNIYIPLTIMSNILGNCRNLAFGYNGQDLYYLGTTTSDGELLGYYIYDTPLSALDTRSQEVADYTYNEFLFTVSHFYGLYEKRIPQTTDLDSIIDNMGYKEDLLSTDTEKYEIAMANFIACWLSDGHAGYTFCSPYGADDYNHYREIGLDYSKARNPRVNKLYNDFYEIGSLKQAANKEVGLEIKDNTAIIRFDEFIKFYPVYYDNIPSSDVDLDEYTYPELHDLGTDLLFRKAFNEIENNPNIENVVVDIANNGGGMLDVLPFLEAYFTSDPSITAWESITGEIIETHYSLDLNYDGVFGDTYEGQYNFFLLTSNASFSCGNYFPTVMKEKGAMTLIGETTGGGECCVGSFATACGTIIRNSSPIHMGHYDYINKCFVGNDDGISPDYEYPRNKFYDTDYLVKFINNLN